MTQSAATPSLTHAEIRSIILGILLALLLGAIDQTIVATAMPTIGHALGDMEHLPWIVTAYLLAATAVTPLYGKISDIYGRRIVLLVGITIFVAGSLACALADSMVFLAVSRAVQGLGGGGLISLAQTIIADILPPRERPRYQVYIASVFVTASLAGPVLGGFLAEHVHWSAIFWINLPLGAAAFVMTFRSLRKLPRHERPHKLDILGAAVMVLATTSLLLALSWGGTRYGWGSPVILSIFMVSAISWLLFVLRLRTAPEPLIPLDILSDNVVRFGTLTACFTMGTFIGLTIYAPIYLQTVYGLSASKSGLAVIPLMVGTVTGATISGRMMAYVVNYKRLPTFGLAIGGMAVATLAMMPNGLPLWAFEVLSAMTSLGLGTVLPVTTVSIQNAVKPHQLGTATANMNFFRQLGGAILVAIFGAIVLSGIPSDKLVGMTHETLSVLLAQSGMDIMGTFRSVFATAAATLTLGLASLIAMQQRPLRGPTAPAADSLGTESIAAE